MLDEVRNGLYYFEESLWELVPRLYREVELALAAAYPGEAFDVPPFLRFGSWIGGDRDGHTHVTAQITEQTLRLHRETAFALYEGSLAELERELSVAAEPDRVSDALARSLDADAAAMPELASSLALHFANEPYRRKGGFIQARIAAARRINAARLRERRRGGAAAEGDDDPVLGQAQRLWGSGAPRSLRGPTTTASPTPGPRSWEPTCVSSARAFASIAAAGSRTASWRTCSAACRSSASIWHASTCASTARSWPPPSPRC